MNTLLFVWFLENMNAARSDLSTARGAEDEAFSPHKRETVFSEERERDNLVCFLLQAGTVRDSMAKSLYSALFDWIVFRINHALLNVKDLVETTKVGPHTQG